MAEIGRPPIYTTEIGERICELIACSAKSLATIAQEVDVKYGTIRHWIGNNKEFSAMYARAKEDQADFLAEQILGIADDSSNDTIEGEYGPMENKEWVNRSKLRVDARKWIASKLKPKRYGDKLDMTTGGDKLNSFEIIIDGEDSNKDN